MEYKERLEEIISGFKKPTNSKSVEISLDRLASLLQENPSENASTFELFLSQILLHNKYNVPFLNSKEDNQNIMNKLGSILKTPRLAPSFLENFLKYFQSEAEKGLQDHIDICRRDFFSSLFIDFLNQKNLENAVEGMIFSEELLDVQINKLLKLPLVFSNYSQSFAKKMHSAEFFKNLFGILEKNEIFWHKNESKVHFFNKISINDFVEIMLDFIKENGKENNPYFIFLHKNLELILRPDKFFSAYLKYLEKETTKPDEQKYKCLVGFLENLKPSKIIEILLHSFVWHDNQAFNYFQAKILGKYINECLILDDRKRILLNVLQKWATQAYIMHASKRNQKYLTNLLKYILVGFSLQDLEDEGIFHFLQEGIQLRLTHNVQFDYVHESGKIVWKQISIILRQILPSEALSLNEEFKTYLDEFPESEDETTIDKGEPETREKFEAEVEKIKENCSKPEIFEGKSEDSGDEFMEIDVSNCENLEPDHFSRPKHLYDCLLGLRSDNPTRLRESLRSLPFLIRKNLDDLHSLSEDLIAVLLKIPPDDEDLDEARKKAICSLIIMDPEKISTIIIDEFFSSKCSLGAKSFVLVCLKWAITELADNPEKYPLEAYDCFEKGENQDFYFRKVSTRLYSAEEKKNIEERNKDLEKKSRRWGETRKKYESARNLKPIKRNDLIVINSQSDSPFLNRFNLICEGFFYPMLREYQKQAGYLAKQQSLLAEFIGFVMVVLENAKNCAKFYYMLEESLDFLISVKDGTDLLVSRSKMQCLLKITLFIKAELVYRYPLVVEYLIKVYKDLQNKKESLSHDLMCSYAASEIMNNVRIVLNI